MTVLSWFGGTPTFPHISCVVSVLNKLRYAQISTQFFISGTRNLSSHSEPRPKAITKDDKRDFMSVFPDIVRELTQSKQNEKHGDLSSLVAKIMQYNVSGGKNIRGLTTVYSYKMLAPERDLTPENIRLVQILGWCIEMLQAFFIVIDDVTDQSELRRKRPCWYKLPDVGLRATSDAIIIEAEAFNLIQRHFRDKSYYVKLLELFLDTIRKTTYGQLLDSVTTSSKLNSLNMDRYYYIVKHKTSYYTYHLPVAVGMYMAGINNEELHRQAKSVLLEIGNYFQVQDDYLDVFGDEEVTGKRGTDIQEGKGTWLAIVAFQRASPSQRAVLEECYGKKEEDKAKAVKDIFLEIGLPSWYKAYEEETCSLINNQIQQLSADLPHELFFTLLNRIHGRKM